MVPSRSWRQLLPWADISWLGWVLNCEGSSKLQVVPASGAPVSEVLNASKPRSMMGTPRLRWWTQLFSQSFWHILSVLACPWLQVVQAIGAPESEALNFSNPKKIDGDGAIALVDAAVALGVDQYVMVTSLGTAKVGFPAGEIAVPSKDDKEPLFGLCCIFWLAICRAAIISPSSYSPIHSKKAQCSEAGLKEC
jgi:hypothetical protein